MKGLIKFFKNINKIWFAGFLWLVTSIPVVTLGASTTALIYTEMQIRRGTLRSTVQESYFRAFKDNIKSGTILLAIYAVLIGGLMTAAHFLGAVDPASASAKSASIIRYIVVGVLIVVAMSASFAFAVQARFTNTVKGTILYSCVMSTRNLLSTVIILAAVYGLVKLCSMFFPLALMILLVVGAGIVFYVFSYFYCKAFLPYIPDEKRTEEEREYARTHHIPSGIENAAQSRPQDTAGSGAADEAEDSSEAAESSESETDSEDGKPSDEEADDEGTEEHTPVKKISLSEAPTGVYPRGRKHSMADIIAATANEADDDEEN